MLPDPPAFRVTDVPALKRPARFIEPLEPEVVVRLAVVALSAPTVLMLMLPLAVRAKLLPLEAPRLTDWLSTKVTLPAVLAASPDAAARIGEALDPMSPLPEVRDSLLLPRVRVAFAVLVIAPAAPFIRVRLKFAACAPETSTEPVILIPPVVFELPITTVPVDSRLSRDWVTE